MITNEGGGVEKSVCDLVITVRNKFGYQNLSVNQVAFEILRAPGVIDSGGRRSIVVVLRVFAFGWAKGSEGIYHVL